MSGNIQGSQGQSYAVTSGALAQGSTASQFTNAAAINYFLNGVYTTRAIVASQALVIEPNSGVNPVLPQAFVTLAAGESCGFAVILDSAGAFTVAQGPIVPAGQKVTLPMCNDNKLIVGAIKVSNATNPFVPGTTNFNAAGVTTTYFNLSGHPGYAL